MIVCTECGNAAPSGDGFCLSCGALLEWSGERVATAPGPTDTSDAGPTGAGQVSRQPDAEASRPEPTPLVVEPAHTGPFCSACGVRNPEGRTFCRSCGEPLRVIAVEVPPRLPWWRRMLAALRGRREFAAGDRPRGFRQRDVTPDAQGRRRLFRLPRRVSVGRFGPVLVLLGLVGMGLGPLRQWVTHEFFTLTGQAKERLNEHFVSVVPVGATGSAAIGGHPAGHAVDGVRDTYFASVGHRDGVGATVTVRFAKPVDIDRIGILSGAPGGDFRTDARPHTVEVAVSGAQPVRLSLDDTADFQNQPVTLRGVRSVTLTVVDVYPGQRGHAVAVREVQFFDRQP